MVILKKKLSIEKSGERIEKSERVLNFGHKNSKKFKEMRSRFFQEGFDCYTIGVDVQRKGELYWSLLGWRKGKIITGHILDYNIAHWKDVNKFQSLF